jgi:hypothetical protein
MIVYFFDLVNIVANMARLILIGEVIDLILILL